MEQTPKKESIHCHQCPAWKKSSFRDLTKENLDELKLQKTSFEINRGSTLNEKGHSTNGAYCIGNGHLKIVWNENNNDESIVKIASPGDMTGYRCLFSEEHFRATAVALTPVQGCFIPKENFNNLIETNTAFNKEILNRMGREIKLSEEWLHAFCRKNVRERMAFALLLLKENCGVLNEDKWILDIQLTREEMSSWIGTAKETVVRCLSDMKDEKVISQEGAHIVILNLDAIKKIAGH